MPSSSFDSIDSLPTTAKPVVVEKTYLCCGLKDGKRTNPFYDPKEKNCGTCRFNGNLLRAFKVNGVVVQCCITPKMGT